MPETVHMDHQDQSDFLEEHYWGVIAAQVDRLGGVLVGVCIEGLTNDADVKLNILTFHSVDSPLDPDYEGYGEAWEYVISLDGVILSEPSDEYIADSHRGPFVFEVEIIGGTEAFPVMRVIG